MRNASAADLLFSKTRQGIFAATFLNPERWWYLSELARHLHLTPSSLQRELDSLVKGGVLRQKREGRQVYFSAKTDSPLYPDLRGIVLKTVGLADVLRRLLAPFSRRIEFAFIYGSIARSEEHCASDVDLMIIGNLSLSELSPPLRKVEEIISRPINPSIYSRAEILKKMKSDHHFVRNVIQSKKIFIRGDPGELDKAFSE